MSLFDIAVLSLFSVGVLALLVGIFCSITRLLYARQLVFLRVLMTRKDSDADERQDTIKDFREHVSLMEQFLTSFKQMDKGSVIRSYLMPDFLSFELSARPGEVSFALAVHRKYRIFVEKQLSAIYTDIVIEEIDEPVIFEEETVAMGAEIELEKKYFIPFKSYKELESDPINPILSSLAKLSEGERAAVQVVVRSMPDTWQDNAQRYEKKLLKKAKKHHENILSRVFSMFLKGVEEHKDASDHDDYKDANTEHIAEKAKKVGYTVAIRVMVSSPDPEGARAELEHFRAAFSQFASPGYNRFKMKKIQFHGAFFRRFLLRLPSDRWWYRPMILSLEEIASLYHFPHSKYNKIHEIKWQRFKIVGAPADLPTEGILLGHNEYRGKRREIRLQTEDRFRHFYVIGQTGTGKTSILQSMARQDIRSGQGLAVMDPHGDFANDLLPFIPKERAEDVIYFNPADLERPLGLNMLEYTGEDDKQAVVQDALAIMIRLFGHEIFGPRIQDYFRNGAITLMDYPEGGAITDIVRLFTDDEFQRARRMTVKDPAVRQWWEGVYSKQGDREKGEIIPYFQAKFGGFITNRMMRNIIGQTKSSFDVYDAMQDGKILLINLSKGLLGDFNSNLLGMVLVSKMQIAAMRRQSIAKADRRDFFLYIDEFQNYVTESIESILSEARKYRLGLNIAHQYLAQLQKGDNYGNGSLNLKDAIFGNVGTIVSYRISSDDGEQVSEIMKPNFSDFDLINQDKFRAVCRPLIDSQPTPAFSLIPLNPYLEEGDPKYAQIYTELSRLKYGRDRVFVEKELSYRIGGQS